MLSFHQKLIHLRNKLGYQDSDEGVCATISEKGIDYWLLGEKGRIAFKKRCELIDKYYQLLPFYINCPQQVVYTQALLQVNKNTPNDNKEQKTSELDQRQVTKVVKFLQRGDYYHQPRVYFNPEKYGEELSGVNVVGISRYAQSEKLRLLGGRAQLASYGGVYNRDELKKYLALLNTLGNKSGEDIALSLSSDNHRISLCYDHAKKSWTIIDANQPDLPPVTGELSYIAHTLADHIFTAFDDTKVPHVLFQTRLFTTGNKQRKLQPLVDEFLRNNEFVTLHKPTLERQMRLTTSKASIAFIAALEGDVATLNKIISENPNIDLNQKNADGFSLALVAAQNGHLDVLKLLASIKDAKGEPVVDFNQTNNVGITPGMIAAKHGYVKVLQLLTELKNVDGSMRVDFNKLNGQDDTLFHDAAFFGQPAVLQFLMGLKKPNGIALLDRNKKNKDGFTPAHMAVCKGKLSALKTLAENGADIEIDNDGWSPLEVAKNEGHQNVIDFFKAWELRKQLLAKANAMEADEKYQSQHKEISQLKKHIIRAFHENHQPFLNEKCFDMVFQKIHNLARLAKQKPAPLTLFSAENPIKRTNKHLKPIVKLPDPGSREPKFKKRRLK